MRKAHALTPETIKKSERAHQAAQEPARPNQKSAVQAMAPQAVYRRAQFNPAGLTRANLLTLQRTVGNRTVQRMITRHADSRLVQRFSTYRGGLHEAANYVPQSPRDMSGGKRGLSTFENIDHLRPEYRPAQRIETNNLGADLEAVRNGKGPKDSHVSIVPTNDREVPPAPTTGKKQQQKVTYEKLAAWAQGGVAHPYTAAVMNARQEQVP